MGAAAPDVALSQRQQPDGTTGRDRAADVSRLPRPVAQPAAVPPDRDRGHGAAEGAPAQSQPPTRTALRARQTLPTADPRSVRISWCRDLASLVNHYLHKHCERTFCHTNTGLYFASISMFPWLSDVFSCMCVYHCADLTDNLLADVQISKIIVALCLYRSQG